MVDPDEKSRYAPEPLQLLSLKLFAVFPSVAIATLGISPCVYFIAAANFSARFVDSQVNSGSSRPKCPYALVLE